ncbi:MAG: YitT family protein [Candidatus Gastranaerophilales bacterium]|nr:YitT family protein [Candidatus Gastranaerophilales bacterium]MCM1072204.1 YitT family protein [Bacteroides sp.]
MFFQKKKPAIRVKTKKEIVLEYIQRAFFLIIGSFIVAAALELFLLPNKIIDGGVIGISMMVSHITKGNLGAIIFAINFPFVILAYKTLGRKFVFNTFFAITMLSIATNVVLRFNHVTDDLLLATIFGGILLGLGVGLILRNNASLDGTEMVSLRLAKKLKVVSVGELLMGMNLFVYAGAGFLFGWDRALYSVLTYYVASKVIDTVIEGLDKAKSVRIVSDFSREIGDSIMKELDISVTYMKTLGGYSRQEKILTYCIVNKFDMAKLKEVVHNVDPNAFIVTEDVHEVEGGRFRRKSSH